MTNHCGQPVKGWKFIVWCLVVFGLIYVIATFALLLLELIRSYEIHHNSLSSLDFVFSNKLTRHFDLDRNVRTTTSYQPVCSYIMCLAIADSVIKDHHIFQ